MVDYIEAYPEVRRRGLQDLPSLRLRNRHGHRRRAAQGGPAPAVVFDPTKLPELGKIWAGQERLWIQRTVLEVVAQVNKKAKDWDSAIIKQINLLEVGNQVAQDQRSIAKGEQLEEAEAIKAPGSEAAEEAAAAARRRRRHGGDDEKP